MDAVEMMEPGLRKIRKDSYHTTTPTHSSSECCQDRCEPDYPGQFDGCTEQPESYYHEVLHKVAEEGYFYNCNYQYEPVYQDMTEEDEDETEEVEKKEEVLDIHEIVKRFELKDLNRSNARFYAAKLFWIYGEYWRAMADSEFSEFAKAYLAKHRPSAASLPDVLRDGLLRVIREKIRTGKELAEWMDPYLTEDYSYSPEARKKQFSNPDTGKLLHGLEQGVAALDGDLTDVAAEAICKKVAEDAALPKPAKVIHLLRAAVSGHTVGPSLFPLLTRFQADVFKLLRLLVATRGVAAYRTELASPLVQILSQTYVPDPESNPGSLPRTMPSLDSNPNPN